MFFQEAGTILSYELPSNIENNLMEQMSEFLDLDKVGKPIIRLQVVYGGSIIPLHIDQTRGASIVYPIVHSDIAHTNFYSSTYTYNTVGDRGLVDPEDCTLTDTINITTTPVLLNTDKIHAVSYNKGQITKDNPRISITFKWKESVYNQIEAQLD